MQLLRGAKCDAPRRGITSGARVVASGVVVGICLFAPVVPAAAHDHERRDRADSQSSALSVRDDDPFNEYIENPNTTADYFATDIDVMNDFDGDALSEVVVGAGRNPVGAHAGAGEVFVFAAIDGSLLATIHPPNPQSSGAFGGSVAVTDDLTGDDRQDLLVYQQSPQLNYVYDGVTLELATTISGGRLYTLSDVDMDGTSDFMRLAASSTLELVSGATWATLRSIPLEAYAPWRPESGGDLDGDGVGDIIVGSPYWNDEVGRVDAYSGATGETIWFNDYNPRLSTDAQFGAASTSLGDVNGNGHDDVAVAAPQFDEIWVLDGMDGALLYEVTDWSSGTYDLFGYSLDRLPDVTGDGIDDIIAGLPSNDECCYVYDVGGTMTIDGVDGGWACIQCRDGKSDPAQRRTDFGPMVGYLVAGIPDVDQDGRGEAAIASKTTTPGGGLVRVLRSQIPPYCDGFVPNIIGTESDDVLEGTAGPDVISALGGNDVVRGLGGTDFLCGGGGRDQIRGGHGRAQDVLRGGSGRDVLRGGGGGTPHLYDQLYGEGGDDRLFGQAGTDLLDGGPGEDNGDGGAALDDMCRSIEHPTNCEVEWGGPRVLMP